MSTVLLVVLLIIAIIVTGLILIQRSEGGALGIGGGGGGGGGGFMSGRAATNSVQRMTWILGSVFLVLCLVLNVTMKIDYAETSVTNIEGETSGLTSGSDSDQTATPLDEATPPAEDTLETVPDQSATEAEASAEDPVDPNE